MRKMNILQLLRKRHNKASLEDEKTDMWIRERHLKECEQEEKGVTAESDEAGITDNDREPDPEELFARIVAELKEKGIYKDEK